jgi:hypothetical protein
MIRRESYVSPQSSRKRVGPFVAAKPAAHCQKTFNETFNDFFNDRVEYG